MYPVKPVLSQFTEFNVAHLGLIPIQQNLPEAVRQGWQSVVGDEENGAGIRAETASKAGVPHGLASDVFAGLVTGSIAAREGGETTVRVTLAELARLSHMTLRAATYVNLRECLQQLRGTRFQIWNKWRTPLYSVANERDFSLIDEFQTTVKEHLFDPAKKEVEYDIRLNPNIIQSIDGALTLMADTTLLTQLNSPMARGLYRVLEAFRRDPEEFTRTHDHIVLSARELAEACRLVGGRNEAAKRLEPLLRDDGPIEQLKKAGYLLTCDTSGRGWETKLNLHFVHSNNSLNVIGLRLLRESGVTGKNASSLASLHTTEEIECAIWMVDQKVKNGGIKNPPGLIISTLKERNFPGYLSSYRDRKSSVSLGNARPIKIKSQPSPKEVEIQFTEQELRNQAQSILTQLGALRRLTPEQCGFIQEALDNGKVTPAQITKLTMMTSETINLTLKTWFQK